MTILEEKHSGLTKLVRRSSTANTDSQMQAPPLRLTSCVAFGKTLYLTELPSLCCKMPTEYLPHGFIGSITCNNVIIKACQIRTQINVSFSSPNESFAKMKH